MPLEEASSKKRMPVNVTLIGVAGGSGSGKTTYTRRAHQILGSDESAILLQDSYYFDQGEAFDRDDEEVNFDHPESLDLELLAYHLRMLKSGQSVQVPVYDFKTHRRLPKVVEFSPKPVIFLEGILILTHPQICQLLDYTVFIDCESQMRLERRLSRDTVERGRTADGVRRQFLSQVEPMHRKYVQPSSARADLKLSQEQYLADQDARHLLKHCHRESCLPI